MIICLRLDCMRLFQLPASPLGSFSYLLLLFPFALITSSIAPRASASSPARPLGAMAPRNNAHYAPLECSARLIIRFFISLSPPHLPLCRPPPLRTYLVSQRSAHCALRVHTSLAVCPVTLALQLGEQILSPFCSAIMSTCVCRAPLKVKSDLVRAADEVKAKRET